ncbi:hypothetical protein CYMTET_34678, partial [Cymbomonas tetramitiformis]
WQDFPLDLQDHNGRTLLHHSCRSPEPNAFPRLLARGAGCQLVDVAGRGALEWAMASGQLDKAVALLRWPERAAGCCPGADAAVRKQAGIRLDVESLASNSDVAPRTVIGSDRSAGSRSVLDTRPLQGFSQMSGTVLHYASPGAPSHSAGASASASWWQPSAPKPRRAPEKTVWDELLTGAQRRANERRTVVGRWRVALNAARWLRVAAERFAPPEASAPPEVSAVLQLTNQVAGCRRTPLTPHKEGALRQRGLVDESAPLGTAHSRRAARKANLRSISSGTWRVLQAQHSALEHGWPLLHESCLRGDGELLMELCTHGGDVNAGVTMASDTVGRVRTHQGFP